MKPLILFPCNGNAREAVGVVEAINRVTPTWSLLGFVDDDVAGAAKRQQEYPLLGTRAAFEDYPDAYVLAVPGRPENFWQRLDLIDALAIDPMRQATVIHPMAHIGPECTVGPNTLIHAGVVLTTAVHLAGDHVILPNTVIAHDVHVGRGTLIGSNVSIAGGVHIESCAYIGSGSNMLQDTRVGTQALVGLGSTVIHDAPAQAVVAGNPARILRHVSTETQ